MLQGMDFERHAPFEGLSTGFTCKWHVLCVCCNTTVHWRGSVKGKQFFKQSCPLIPSRTMITTGTYMEVHTDTCHLLPSTTELNCLLWMKFRQRNLPYYYSPQNSNYKLRTMKTHEAEPTLRPSITHQPCVSAREPWCRTFFRKSHKRISSLRIRG